MMAHKQRLTIYKGGIMDTILNNINKDEWELVKLGDFWRFVDHTNKLLTTGWANIDNMDIEIIRVDKVSIPYMLERYQDYF